MRVNKYTTRINEEEQTILVKECSTNYTGIKRLSSPKEIAKIMQDVFSLGMCAEEYVYMIGLNNVCNPVGFFEISHGTVNSCLLQPRELLIRALLSGASGIIICHNHPGNCPVPSQKDIDITHKLKEACDLIGIIFHDHIIISRNSYLSFSEAKLL